MPQEKIQVVKLPGTIEKDVQKQPFPKMPRLYLELLENKRKIKPELVNKEFVSKTEGDEIPDISRGESRRSDESRHSVASKISTGTPEISESKQLSKHSNDSSESFKKDSEFDDFFGGHDRSLPDSVPDSRSGSRSDVNPRGDSYSRDSSRHSRSDVPSTPRSSASSNSGKKESKVSERLKELLDGDDDEDNVTPKNGTSKPMNVKLPPSLAELEKSGQITRKREAVDVADMSEVDTEDLKREYLFKFDILRKSFGGANSSIPEFTIHSDLQTIKKTYESTLRTLTLDRTVGQYKQYMTYGFGMIEFLFGSFFNFDMAGFSTQQQLNMSQYEYLLVELGEKSYVPTGSKYPVEVRLLFVVILNTAFFLVTKIVLRKTGVNIGMTQQPQQTSSQPQQKKKMKGPVVNVDDIPDM